MYHLLLFRMDVRLFYGGLIAGLVLVSTDDDFQLPACIMGRVVCPKIYAPICGTDMVTYTNECEMCRLTYVEANPFKKQQRIKIRNHGVCPEEKYDTTPYTKSGTSLVDWSEPSMNEVKPEFPLKNSFLSWFMNQQFIQQRKHFFPRRPDCPPAIQKCDPIVEPVCSSEGKLYVNECSLCNVIFFRKMMNSKTYIYIKRGGSCIDFKT